MIEITIKIDPDELKQAVAKALVSEVTKQLTHNMDEPIEEAPKEAPKPTKGKVGITHKNQSGLTLEARFQRDVMPIVASYCKRQEQFTMKHLGLEMNTTLYNYASTRLKELPNIKCDKQGVRLVFTPWWLDGNKRRYATTLAAKPLPIRGAPVRPLKHTPNDVLDDDE